MTILHLNIFFIFFYDLLILRVSPNTKTKNIFLVIVTLQFIIINSIRSSLVGTDTSVYYARFMETFDIRSIENLLDIQRFEPGYALLQYLVSMFTYNFNVLLLVTSLFIYIPLAIFIYKFSDDYFISYFLFITLRHFDFSLSGIRQAIAISIGLFAFHFAMENKPLKFLIVVMMAASFHYSALVLIPLYFIVNLKPKQIHLFFLMLAYVVLYLFRDFIGQLLVNLYFEDSTYMNAYQNIESVGLFGMLLLVIIIIGAFFNNPYNEETPKIFKALFNVSVVSFFIHAISSYSYYFKRLNMYYAILIIIYLSNSFKNTETSFINFNKNDLKLIRRVVLILLVITLTIYYFSIINQNLYQILPYETFLSI